MQHVISGLAPFSEILVRARPRSTAAVINTEIHYLLNIGSLVTNLEDLTPDGDRAARVPPSHTPWARVQNAENFTWSAKATDSTGNPVRNLQLSFRADNEFGAYAVVTSSYTNYQGIVTHTKEMNTYCAPNAQNQYLNILYHAGRYHIHTTYYSDYSDIENSIQESWLMLCTDY